MQRHSRLPRAGTALDDQNPGQWRTDDFVLLALDRPDDVPHLAGARLAQRGQQRPGATQDEPVREQPLPAVPELSAAGTAWGHRARPAIRIHEVLVLEPEHGTPPHREVAAAGQALGIESRGTVEGLRHGGAPVHHQRLVIGARDGEPADVEGLAQQGGLRAGVVARLRETVDASEVQRLVADVELLQAGQAGAHHDVALGARLERAAPAEVEHALQHLARLAPHELQPVIGTVEELLLIQ